MLRQNVLDLLVKEDESALLEDKYIYIYRADIFRIWHISYIDKARYNLLQLDLRVSFSTDNLP